MADEVTPLGGLGTALSQSVCDTRRGIHQRGAREPFTVQIDMLHFYCNGLVFKGNRKRTQR